MLLFSRSVVSDSATPWTAACQASLSFTVSRACSNSCPLSWWCHPTILPSVVPFSSCPQSFPYMNLPHSYIHVWINKCVRLHLYLYLYDNVKWFFKPKTEMNLTIRTESSLWEKSVCLSSVRVGCSQVAHGLDVTNQMKKWRLFCQFGVVIS